jgi:peroxiredoxin
MFLRTLYQKLGPPWLLAAALLGTASATYAQSPTSTKKPAAAPAAPPATAVQLEGKTTDGKAFSLAQLKGKVVMVMFWNTSCAVCRDKMPELRTNYEGWKGKPFELVLVSTDRNMKDVDDYDKIISQSVPIKQRFISLWAGAPGFKHGFGSAAQLPATYVINAQGKVVDSYIGRVPAEAWDKVAELM